MSKGIETVGVWSVFGQGSNSIEVDVSSPTGLDVGRPEVRSALDRELAGAMQGQIRKYAQTYELRSEKTARFAEQKLKGFSWRLEVRLHEDATVECRFETTSGPSEPDEDLSVPAVAALCLSMK